MSDELISLSDFLDWADFCASVYGRRSLTLMDGVTQDDYERVVTIGNEFIACCYIRERYLAVIDMALELQRFNDELIRRSTLLNLLHNGVDAYKKGMVASLKRAAEYAHGCISVDAVVMPICLRNARTSCSTRVPAMFTSACTHTADICRRLVPLRRACRRGVIIHEKH